MIEFDAAASLVAQQQYYRLLSGQGQRLAEAGQGQAHAGHAGQAGQAGQGGPEELDQAEQQELRRLKARDREVRAHENAHRVAAGNLARGVTQYQYERGPDGALYAVAGEVQIDTSPVPGDPEATIDKAQRIIRAALAPAQPSSQDRAVAAKAAAMEAKARLELASEKGEGQPTGVTPRIDFIA